MIGVDGHYAHCRDLECVGCLPTDESLATMHILGLWGEMAQRAIAQTPATKTRQGAFDAIVADGPKYRAQAAKIREHLAR